MPSKEKGKDANVRKIGFHGMWYMVTEWNLPVSIIFHVRNFSLDFDKKLKPSISQSSPFQREQLPLAISDLYKDMEKVTG